MIKQKEDEVKQKETSKAMSKDLAQVNVKVSPPPLSAFCLFIQPPCVLISQMMMMMMMMMVDVDVIPGKGKAEAGSNQDPSRLPWLPCTQEIC